MRRPCLVCGTPVQRGPRCRRHQLPKVERSTADWKRARKLALDRDLHRCTATHDGRRCPTTRPLEVHHLNGNPQDHRPQNLATLCTDHHHLTFAKG